MSAEREAVAVEAERSLLGALMLDNKDWRTVRSIVNETHLSSAEHRSIFSAIAKLSEQGELADPVLVANLMGGTLVEACGGMDYIANLVRDTTSAASVRAYAKIVADAANRLKLVDIGERIAARARSGQSAADALKHAQEQIGRVELGERPAVALPLRVVSLADLATTAPIPVRFVIEPILPRGFVSLLAGHGDAGKSMLALTMAAHIATGTPFADLTTFVGRVLFVSLEDSGDLVKLRLRRIADAYGFDINHIIANITIVEGGLGEESALAFEHSQDGIRRLLFTSAYEQISSLAIGHDLIIVDNSSDAYDANENERRLVRRFIRGLQGAAQAASAACLLLAHLDKAAVRHGANGESYSGSTAWHNSVRSRLALTSTDTGFELAHEKCNVAKKLDAPISLERVDHGVPKPLAAAVRAQHQSADKHAVLAAIRGCVAAGIAVPTAQSGPRTAISVLSGRPEMPEDLAGSHTRIRKALGVLEREAAIWRELYRDDQRKTREKYGCASSPHYV